MLLALSLAVPSVAQGYASIYSHSAAFGPDVAIPGDVTIFFSDGVNTEFECRLDSGSWQACTNPKTYTGLADGPHSFGVRTLGDSSVATFEWVTDNTPPVVTIDSGPEALTKDKSASFSWHWTDLHPAGGYVLCSLDSQPLNSGCDSPKSFADLADGNRRLNVAAVDGVGNVSATAVYEWTIDTTPPDTQITSKPNLTTYSTTADFTLDAFPEPPPRDKFECSLDGAEFTSCGSSKSYPGLAPGSHTFSARAIDRVGLVDQSPATYTWTVLAAPLAPDTTITEGPMGTVASTTALFYFSSPSLAASFECSLDGSGFVPCSAGYYTDLSEGSHTFAVRAVDSTGPGAVDPTPATRTWIVDLTPDTTPPDTTITSGPSGTISDPTPTFEFTSEPGATFECRVDGGPFAACSSPKTVAALTDGAHTFDVRATDTASNTDPTPASGTFNVDTSAPPSGTSTLTAAKSGTGAGTITSSPAGINCGADCSQAYDSGTAVTLTATPGPGSTFTGWSGAGCSGTGTCRVTLDSGGTATANFAAVPSAKASISRIQVMGPASVKKGNAATYKVRITNSGGAGATGVKLAVSGPGVSFGSTVGTIPAGTTRTVKAKLKPKKTGKVRLTFKATSSNAGARSVAKTVTVRK